MNLLLAILLFAPFSYSIVPNNTIIHEYAVSCTGRRSLWQIIKSCATTLFACAWTAIHPNMPGPVEGGVAIGSRRLGSMMLALVAPELVLMWAIHQFFDALVVQKQFQKALQDGTLELRVKHCCEPRLVSAKVLRRADEARITIPEETTESWYKRFFSSITAMFRRPSYRVRKTIGPSSVSVESLTGYCRWTLKHSFYAWMGGFMLFIDKDPVLPREVYHPLTPDELFEFLTADLVQMTMLSEKELDSRSKGDWLSKTIAIIQLVWFVVQLATRAFGDLPTTQLEIDTLAISILSGFTYTFWWYKPKDAQWYVPVYWKEPGEFPNITYSVPQSMTEFLRTFGVKESWISSFFGDMLRPLLNLGGIHCVSDAAIKAHRVPYFCGYSPDVDKRTLGQHLPVYIIGASTGMLFGGVHCIAWNFTFPTYTEQMLWRVASLMMAVMPALALAAVGYAYLTSDGTTVPHATAAASYMLAVNFLYEVCWTSLIPHW